MPTHLRVAVTGDTGFDIYTQYVEGYVSQELRVRKPEAAHDLYVPSGAGFTSRSFCALFSKLPPSLSISVSHLQPDRAAIPTASAVLFSTLQKNLIELDSFKPVEIDGLGNREILRVKRVRPIHDKDPVQKPTVFRTLIDDDRHQPDSSSFDLLVIHDGAGSWRHYPEQKKNAGAAFDFVKSFLDHPTQSIKSDWPRVIVNLNHDLPDVERNTQAYLSFPDKLPFWQVLDDHRPSVCIICSVNMLRREGAAISRRLSWEQTVEDLATDLLLFDKLQALARFGHLVVRIGMIGAVYFRTDCKGRTADLVFAPTAKNGIYRDPIEDGSHEGQNTFLAAALTRTIAEFGAKDPTRAHFVNALKSGLAASMCAFDNGYRVNWNQESGYNISAGNDLIKNLCTTGSPSAADLIGKEYVASDAIGGRIFGDTPIPAEVLDRPPGSWSGRSSTWELLRTALNPSHHGFNEQVSRINVGVAIVLFGQDRVLNQTWDPKDDYEILKVLTRPSCSASSEEMRDHITLSPGQKPTIPTSLTSQHSRQTSNHPAIYVPVMNFGQLTVVERNEIEGIRSIRNLVQSYHEQSVHSHALVPPISVAVFGPPGSGKSFAVKQIVEDINRSLHDSHSGLETVEYNMAQLRNVEELGDAITRASVINNEGKTPVIFFDEFDCPFGGNELGWLKYFLAPMQDGTFYGVRQTIKIGRAVFVFAGGIYHAFNAFDPSADMGHGASTRREFDEVERRRRVFADQKGPDFVSRLRGHINILPVNSDEGEIKPIIRRAIILRGLMQKRGLIVRTGNNAVAYIDEDIVYALLSLDRYRHGARSMEAILQMCSPIEEKIEKASLPSRSQLNMHIDADEFFIRMYRGRLRRSVGYMLPMARQLGDEQNSKDPNVGVSATSEPDPQLKRAQTPQSADPVVRTAEIRKELSIPMSDEYKKAQAAEDTSIKDQPE
jgi:hypothetical protein